MVYDFRIACIVVSVYKNDSFIEIVGSESFKFSMVHHTDSIRRLKI